MLSRPKLYNPINKTPIQLREGLSKDREKLKTCAEKERNMKTTIYKHQVKEVAKRWIARQLNKRFK